MTEGIGVGEGEATGLLRLVGAAATDPELTLAAERDASEATERLDRREAAEMFSETLSTLAMLCSDRPSERGSPH